MPPERPRRCTGCAPRTGALYRLCPQNAGVVPAVPPERPSDLSGYGYGTVSYRSCTWNKRVQILGAVGRRGGGDARSPRAPRIDGDLGVADSASGRVMVTTGDTMRFGVAGGRGANDRKVVEWFVGSERRTIQTVRSSVASVDPPAALQCSTSAAILPTASKFCNECGTQ